MAAAAAAMEAMAVIVVTAAPDRAMAEMQMVPVTMVTAIRIRAMADRAQVVLRTLAGAAFSAASEVRAAIRVPV